jgi:hypothetical protein
VWRERERESGDDRTSMNRIRRPTGEKEGKRKKGKGIKKIKKIKEKKKKKETEKREEGKKKEK